MRIRIYFMILSFLVLSVLSIKGASAMGLSDVGKVCLFSKMEGVIKLDGVPVNNAKLVRTVNLTKDKTDEAVTDQNGYFKFDAIFARTITKLLPMEFVSNQEVWAHYRGKEYRIWMSVKREPDENSESQGKPFIVECELNSKERIFDVDGSPIFTLCTWDVKPDKKPNIMESLKRAEDAKKVKM